MVRQIITRLLGMETKKATRKILLVEDDTDLVKLIHHYLRPLDCSITTVSTVEEAIKILENDPRYRLVVTDVLLPGKNGLTLVSKLRKSPKWTKIPVLVISSEIPPKTLQALPQEFSRLRVMPKPLRMKPFQETVEDALKTAFGNVPSSAPLS